MKTIEVVFIFFLLFVLSFLVIDWPIPVSLAQKICDEALGGDIIVRLGKVSLGFRGGLTLKAVKITDRTRKDALGLLAGADEIKVDFRNRQVEIRHPVYTALPDSYYAPGNLERNARVEGGFPELPSFHLKMYDTDILGIRARQVFGEVKISPSQAKVSDIVLIWPERERSLELEGHCTVDLAHQRVQGGVKGLARQRYIRPLIVALDIPVSLPYFDAFTFVNEPVPAECDWDVNLINNDFDLDLKLHPDLGRYNEVPMKHADGRIRIHTYTRGTSLNYQTTVGPIDATDTEGRALSGSVVISGTNGYNTVTVKAMSAMKLADILKIGGFTGEYVSDEVIGNSKADLEFRFPRAMTNNYEVLNGRGHVEIKNGQLMRMKGFAGLVELMAEKVPGVDFITDRTQASGDYTIENGVIKSDNFYIEGGLFSIKMYGSFDTVKDNLDYTVRVQFMKNDSVLGKIIHPVTWVFTKLLLEYRLTGSAANPKWEYVSIIDRVMEVVK